MRPAPHLGTDNSVGNHGIDSSFRHILSWSAPCSLYMNAVVFFTSKNYEKKSVQEVRGRKRTKKRHDINWRWWQAPRGKVTTQLFSVVPADTHSKGIIQERNALQCFSPFFLALWSVLPWFLIPFCSIQTILLGWARQAEFFQPKANLVL